MQGIEREIDRLGRVVIPVEYRKELGIESGSKLTILLLNGDIVIKAQNTLCALCGSKIERDKGVRLCKKCIAIVKKNKKKAEN